MPSSYSITRKEKTKKKRIYIQQAFATSVSSANLRNSQTKAIKPVMRIMTGGVKKLVDYLTTLYEIKGLCMKGDKDREESSRHLFQDMKPKLTLR
jgi:hypothetical protein